MVKCLQQWDVKFTLYVLPYSVDCVWAVWMNRRIWDKGRKIRILRIIKTFCSIYTKESSGRKINANQMTFNCLFGSNKSDLFLYYHSILLYVQFSWTLILYRKIEQFISLQYILGNSCLLQCQKGEQFCISFW